MSLPRRSVRNAIRVLADFQLGAPETTVGWNRVNEAEATMRAAQLDTEQEPHTTPVEVVAPDRSLIPYLNRLLYKVYKFNSFIKDHQFNNTHPLETTIKNYTEILNEFLTNVGGTLPRMRVDNFNTEVMNNAIISVFDNDRELAEYFSYQALAWEEVLDSFSAGRPVSSDEIDRDIGKDSKEYRTDLIKSIKLLKKHIEKEYPLSHSSVARGRKKSHKRRAKKRSCLTRRKRKPRRKRCK